MYLNSFLSVLTKPIQIIFILGIYYHQVNNHNTRSRYIDINTLITTRSLFIPFSRTKHYGLNQLKVQGPKIWNNISPLIRNNTSIKIFLKELKNTIINSYN